MRVRSGIALPFRCVQKSQDVQICRAVSGVVKSPATRRWLAILTAVTLTGCSIHPIPDDVSPLPTEAIVAAARCELRLGLVETVRDQWFADEDPPINPNIIDPETVAEHLPDMKRRYPNIDLTNDWNEYMDIAIAYDWSFEITETNQVDSVLGFRIPFVSPGAFDLSTGGTLNLNRLGKRTFKNQDKFSNLLTKNWYNFCNDIDRSAIAFPNMPVPRDRNIIHPITGSIGLRKAVKSFLRIAVQEGALDTFTDELTFTTTMSGKIGSTIALAPVTDKFRLVSGAANLAGSRVDVHKVKISLAFPKARPAQRSRKLQARDLAKELDVRGGYQLNPNWRASYALCVTDARSREDELKNLRLTPPEVSCLKSTDAFFPRGNGVETALRTGSRSDLKEERRVLEQSKNPPERAAPPGVRPQ